MGNVEDETREGERERYDVPGPGKEGGALGDKERPASPRW